MASLWRAYSRLVDKYPWRSQILQTGVLCAAGDVIAQVGGKGRGRSILEIFSEILEIFSEILEIFSEI